MKSRFNREQLIFICDLTFTSAWDMIEATLPCSDRDISDYRNNQEARGERILAAVHFVGTELPILYAHLTNDGMGICEFIEFAIFEAQVNQHIVKILTHGLVGIGRPKTKPLAKSFVDRYFSDYLLGK